MRVTELGMEDETISVPDNYFNALDAVLAAIETMEPET